VGLGGGGWDANPREAKGLGGALRDLQQRAWGPWMLGAAAAGLVAYGGYQLVRAGWRRIGGKR